MSNRTKTRLMVQLALLIAIQVLLASTPLGYLPLGVINLTIIHIPAIVGAVVLGPMAGLILGLAFGLTSMIVAPYQGGASAFLFSPFVPGGNIFSAVIAIVPRVLMGLLTAWVFLALKKAGRSARFSAGAAAAAGSACNTVLVLGGIYLFFGREYADLMSVSFNAVLGIMMTVIASNGILELVLAVLVAAALIKPLARYSQAT